MEVTKLYLTHSKYYRYIYCYSKCNTWLQLVIDNYGDVYDNPDAISFTLNVDSKYSDYQR